MKKLLDHTFYDFPPGADLSGSPEQPENTGNIPMSGLPEYIDPRTGDVHEQIPLRDFIRDHPVMQALDPVLKMRPVPEKSGDFKAFRTMLENGAVKPENPRQNDRMISLERERTISLERHYATYLDQTRIFVSRENQFPGTRHIVLLGPAFAGLHGSCIGFMAVMDDGHLFNGHIQPAIRGTAPLPSVAEALEIIMIGRKHWYIEKWNQGDSFNLDLYSQHFRKTGVVLIKDLLNREEYNRIMPVIHANAAERLDFACQALCDSLDRDILCCMRDTGRLDVEFGRWLTNADGAPGNMALVRRQAFRAYPILAKYLYTLPDLRNAIDARTSLSAAIAKKWNVPEARVKRLSGLTRQKVASLRIHEILRLPEGSVPNTRDGFQDLGIFRRFGYFLYQKDLVDTLNYLSRDGNPWRLLDGIKQTNERDISDAVNFLVLKLYIPAGLERVRRIADDLGGKIPKSAKHKKIFSDFMEASRNSDGNFPDFRMKIEKLSHGKMKETGRNNVLSTFTPRELLDFSDWYHRNQARCEDRLETVSLNMEWPGLFGTLDLETECIARELTSSKEIKAQGRREDHCVGGYVSHILNSTLEPGGRMTLIFSIEQENQVLCTAEILCEQTKKESRLQAWVGQCRGYHNKDPSPAAQDMANQVAAILSRTEPAICHAYLDELQRTRVEYNRISKLGPRMMECGFDPWDRNMLETAWEILSPALPRRLRKPGLNDFPARIPVDIYTLMVTLAERATLVGNESAPEFFC